MNFLANPILTTLLQTTPPLVVNHTILLVSPCMEAPRDEAQEAEFLTCSPASSVAH